MTTSVSVRWILAPASRQAAQRTPASILQTSRPGLLLEEVPGPGKWHCAEEVAACLLPMHLLVPSRTRWCLSWVSNTASHRWLDGAERPSWQPVLLMPFVTLMLSPQKGTLWGQEENQHYHCQPCSTWSKCQGWASWRTLQVPVFLWRSSSLSLLKNIPCFPETKS